MHKHMYLTMCMALAMLLFEPNLAKSQQDSATSDLTLADTILFIEANPVLGFNFPYYLRIPKNVNKTFTQYLLVETNNAGYNDTFQYHINSTYWQIKKNSLGGSLCYNLKIPFLMPVFPRTVKDIHIYTHAFDSDAAKIKKGDQVRLDLQLIAMINHAKQVLKTFGIESKEKVFMNGFSASGTFANRFTLIHPNMVAAVACGGINAIAALPLARVENQKLPYPIGIYDFEKLFGKAFDLETYIKVPQLLYMGENDANDATLFDDAYTKTERKIIYTVLGKNMIPDRLKKCENLYTSANTNAVFKIYPKLGHETEQTIFLDVYYFFKNKMDM